MRRTCFYSCAAIACCVLLAAGPLQAQEVLKHHANLSLSDTITSPPPSLPVNSNSQARSTELDREAIRKLIVEESEKARFTGSKASSNETGVPQPRIDTTMHGAPEKAFFHGFEPQQNDGNQRPTINIGGRFDFDNAWYLHGRNLRFGNSNDNKLDDGASIRRLYLRAFGDVMPWLSYSAELNFTNIADFARDDSRTQIQSLGLGDTYLTLRYPPYFGRAELRVGHIQEPFGLERMSSSNALFFPGTVARLRCTLESG